MDLSFEFLRKSNWCCRSTKIFHQNTLLLCPVAEFPDRHFYQVMRFQGSTNHRQVDKGQGEPLYTIHMPSNSSEPNSCRQKCSPSTWPWVLVIWLIGRRRRQKSMFWLHFLSRTTVMATGSIFLVYLTSPARTWEAWEDSPTPSWAQHVADLQPQRPELNICFLSSAKICGWLLSCIAVRIMNW